MKLDKKLLFTIITTISILFVGCGTSKPTPKVEKSLQQNGVGMKSVCMKYPKKLKYESNGKDFSCDAAKITQDMVLWTKINDLSLEKMFQNPSEVMKWKNAGFNNSDILVLKQTGVTISEAKRWKDAGIAISSIKTWKDAGFNISDAKKWESANIKPIMINIWITAGFNSLDAKEWNSMYFSATLAKEYRDAGFTPYEAKKWKDAGFNVLEANKWKSIGFTSYEAKEWSDFKPYDAKKWKDDDFNVSQASEWKDAGFTVETAKKWKKINLTPIKAKNWQSTNFEFSEIKLWTDMDINAEDAKKLKKFGLNSHEVKKWNKIDIKPSNIKEWYKCGVKSSKKAKKLLDKGYKSATAYCKYKNKLKRIKNTKPMKAGRDYECSGEFAGSLIALGKRSMDVREINPLISMFGFNNVTLYRVGSFKNHTLFKGFDRTNHSKRFARVLTKSGIKKNSDINLIYDNIPMHCAEVK